MAKFKVGHVVRLKSGGDRMTVSKVLEENENIECIWFPMVARLHEPGVSEYVYKPELRKENFLASSLEKVVDKKDD